MAGYTPVFDSVYAGTLCGRWPTTAVWVTLLPLCDKHGHIDLSHQAICALTGWPLELLKQGIEELMRADPDSRSNAQDGRRLVLLDPENRSWGWKVVNHGLYREKARKLQYDNERTSSGRDALRKKESREVPRSPDASREVPLSDSDSDSDSDKKEEKTPRRAARGTPQGAGEVSLHESLPKEAWEEWLAHRRKRRWPLDAVTLGKHLKLLVGCDTDTQRRIIDNSINAGWQGLFPLKGNGSTKRPHREAPTTEELEAREAARARQ